MYVSSPSGVASSLQRLLPLADVDAERLLRGDPSAGLDRYRLVGQDGISAAHLAVDPVERGVGARVAFALAKRVGEVDDDRDERRRDAKHDHEPTDSGHASQRESRSSRRTSVPSRAVEPTGRGLVARARARAPASYHSRGDRRRMTACAIQPPRRPGRGSTCFGRSDGLSGDSRRSASCSTPRANLASHNIAAALQPARATRRASDPGLHACQT